MAETRMDLSKEHPFNVVVVSISQNYVKILYTVTFPYVAGWIFPYILLDSDRFCFR
jgi:hypothetical protein